jgi:hypothetical protein
MTSSNTLNVGAPTFGVREQSSRFYGVNHTTEFPKWNDAKIKSPMILKTNYLPKPSSNTLNVGAPTLPPVAHPFRGEAFQNVAEVASIEGKSSGLKGLSYNPGVSR